MSGGIGVRSWCVASTAAVRGRDVGVQEQEGKDAGSGDVERDELTVRSAQGVDQTGSGGDCSEDLHTTTTGEDPLLENGELSASDMSLADSESEAETETDSTNSEQSAPKPVMMEPISCIHEAQLSPDATCIFTAGYDRKFSVYAMPSSSQAGGSPQSLTPYAQCVSSDPIWAFALNPNFDVNDSNTTTVLISRRDQYIHLHNALWDITEYPDLEAQQVTRESPVDMSAKLVSYKLVDHLSEAVTAPLSLEWDHSGDYFYAGQRSKISIFDMDACNNPISSIKTIPSENSKLKGGGRGFKGHITALSLCPSSSTTNANVLAAGARTRNMGLYDLVSSKEITSFSLPGSVCGRKTREPSLQGLMGDGITSLKWSPDGTYLYIAERQSNALLIYDVRNFSIMLGYCAGRQALTMQKLGFDIRASTDEFGYLTGSEEVWAGGTDGKVRVWRDPWKGEGAIQADEVIAVGEGPVGSVLVAPDGGQMVVASGAIELGHDNKGRREMQRGEGTAPSVREWGCLDILGLAGY